MVRLTLLDEQSKTFGTFGDHRQSTDRPNLTAESRHRDAEEAWQDALRE